MIIGREKVWSREFRIGLPTSLEIFKLHATAEADCNRVQQVAETTFLERRDQLPNLKSVSIITPHGTRCFWSEKREYLYPVKIGNGLKYKAEALVRECEKLGLNLSFLRRENPDEASYPWDVPEVMLEDYEEQDYTIDEDEYSEDEDGEDEYSDVEQSVDEHSEDECSEDWTSEDDSSEDDGSDGDGSDESSDNTNSGEEFFATSSSRLPVNNLKNGCSVFEGDTGSCSAIHIQDCTVNDMCIEDVVKSVWHLW